VSDNGNGTARWQLWVSLASVGVVVFGSLMVLYLTATSALQKATALEGRVNRLEEITQTNRTDISVMRAALVETETQFKSADQTRNLMHADDLRVRAMLWKKVFGVEYPIDNAY
jgi:hypothetical protein